MSKSEITFDEILKSLPQRPPFLFIDRVIEMELGKSLVAIKNVTINEAFFAGHFPGYPVMPGVLIIEALAQAAGILAGQTLKAQLGSDELFFFAGIDEARFKRVVVPGDQLRLEIKLLKVKKHVICVEATATVDGELACSAKLMSARKGIADD